MLLRRITTLALIMCPHIVLLGHACLGGFGGGGQACCPPHAAPSCGSSAPSCGGDSTYQAPAYNAPLVYPAPPQPLPPPPPPPPPAYGPSPYQNYYPNQPQLLPSPQVIQQPHAMPAYPMPQGPQGPSPYRPGGGNSPSYPRGGDSAGSPPGHVPPPTASSNAGLQYPPTRGKTEDTVTEEPETKQNEQVNPFHEEDDGKNPYDGKGRGRGSQQQVHGAKKVQESNSAAVEDEISEKKGGGRRGQYDDADATPPPAEHTHAPKDTADVHRYGEETAKNSEEHNTGYRRKM